MRADYDSEADAILIEVEVVERWDKSVAVDDADLCHVGFERSRPVGVTLRCPSEGLQLLDDAADRFELDAGELRAAARAALALPDRQIRIEAGPRRLVGGAAESA